MGATAHALGVGATGRGGEEKHVITTTELPAHNHPGVSGYRFWMSNGTVSGYATGAGNGGSPAGDGTELNTGNRGDGTSHNNLQPFQTISYIIKL